MPRVELVEQDGPKIRRLRESQGITLTDFAAGIRRHPKVISRIERELAQPSAVMINQIARALGVETSEITRPPAGAGDAADDENQAAA